MKKRNGLFFIVVFLLITISSCKFGFESTKFYNQRRRNLDISIDAKQVDTSDPGTIEISADKEKKIQKLFDDAIAKKDEPFPASKFDDWVFYCVNLTDKNVGTYRFDNSGTWTADGNHGETFSNGKMLGSGLRKLTNVTYYRYKDRTARWQAVNYTDFDPFTPERDPDGKLKKREERFLFFRFTAQSGAGPLDNTMLCVDTYTKFCWYYAEPGWLQNILGNKVPKDWVDFESPVIQTSGECEHTRSYGKFYYYDPVGYVQADGNVVLYEWAKNDLEAGYFNPRQNYKETATRTPDGAGKSPYFIHDAKKSEETPQVTVPTHDAGLLVQMSSVKNESFTSVKQPLLFWKDSTELSYAYLFAKATNSISGDSIVFPNNKNTLECKKIPVKENAALTENNNFLLKLSDLQTKKNFELKTETAFANELAIGSQAAKIALNKNDCGVASCSFVSATGTEPAYLQFNGIQKPLYTGTYAGKNFTVKIDASIEAGKKLPLNARITLTLTYTVNGCLEATAFDKRNAPVTDARFSITYTLDFTDGEK